MNAPHDPSGTVDAASVPADSLDAGLAAGFGKAALAPRSTLPNMRPVLLKEPEGDSAHVVKPKSDALPSQAEAGDRYQLSGEIARGGMGAVLRGRDVDLGRDLAVKVLLEKYRHRPGVVQRFIEEAQIAGQLQHPGVVPVYDIGRFGDRPFFTMKLVKGQTLAALLAQRSDPLADQPRFLSIALQVAQTVAYAHAKGVIHRDLKPGNIMVGAFGEVQVMDWGLAKVLAEGGIADEEKASRAHQLPEDVTTIRTVRSSGSSGSLGSATEVGSLLGTPAYMPPEQANGDMANLDRRADVFGLGAILCELLTGKPPYVGRSSEEVRRKASNGDLAGALTRLDGSGADAELIALTRRCLAAEAGDRPGDAQAVAEALGAHLNGMQERLHQAELAEAEAKAKAREEAKRRRLTLALAATVLVALTVGGGSWVRIKNEHEARQLALTRDVNEAVNKATALREQAKVVSTGSAALLARAREQAQRALALIGTGPADAALIAQVSQLQAELDEEEKDRKLLAALDEARLAQADVVSSGNRFALELAIPLFRTAFRAYGMPVGEGEPAEVARQIQQRPAAVQAGILAALDEWDILAGQANLKIAEPHRQWLRAVLAAAEPEDSWSRQGRAARAEKDGEKRQTAMENLAAEADVAKVPAMALVRLGLRLASAPKIALLRRAQAQYPGDFWINQNLGAALWQAKPPQLDEAVRFLTASVSLRPDSAWAHLNLGRVLREKDRLDEAIACYHKAIEIDPQFASAHYNLGHVLEHKGQMEAAMACYRKAIDIDPKFAPAHNSLGTALGRKGQLDAAIASFRKAIELDPKFAGAHNNLGFALLQKGQLDPAIASYQKAIAIDPKSAMAHFNLGRALARKGQFDAAIASYQKAIAIDPKFAKAHYNLGLVLSEKRQFNAAIASFLQAVKYDPTYAMAHYSLGTLQLRVGQVNEAIGSFYKARDIDPKHVLTHNNLGNALFRVNQLEAAVASYQKAIELDPNHALAHNNLGNARMSVGDLDAAIASFNKAIEIDSKYYTAHSNLGIALARKGQLDEAIASYQKAIDIDLKDANTHSQLGDALRRKGKLDEAIASCRLAIKLNPKLAAAHDNLGCALGANGELDAAIASFRQAIKLDLQSASAHINLGVALWRKGELDEAIAIYHKAIELDPKSASAHNGLGAVLLDKGQFDEAIARFRQAIDVDSKYALAYTNLGHSLKRQGRFAECLAAFQQGHELGRNQPDWRHPSLQWVEEAELLVTMEGKLPAFLKGEFQPKDTSERLVLAGVCVGKKLHHAAFGLYTVAFAADPKVAEEAGNRYQAACCAALAAAGQGEDAAKLDDRKRTRLRRQALDWLRAELAMRTRELNSGKPADRAEVRQKLAHWKKDRDLASIRDAAAIAELPADEQQVWTQLWADVEALLKEAAGQRIDDKAAKKTDKVGPR